MVDVLNGTNGTTNRIPADRETVKPPRVRKPKPSSGPPPGSEDKPGAVAVKAPPAADPLMLWAKVGIGMSIVLSAGLNGYANAEHTRPGMEWAGWLIGVWVPMLVVVLARVAGGCYARGWRQLATAGGLVCVVLLGLSVRHCAHSFGVLTGADMWSSIALAIGVDCGLVVCELLTVAKRK